MVYRFSWIAGFASIGFAFWLLQDLIRPTVRGTHWQLIVFAGLSLGVVITWTARSYRLAAPWLIGLNGITFLLAAARYAAPENTVLVFPTWTSLDILRAEMIRALDLVQNGVEPVIPITGLVILLTGLFWALGALLVWGLTGGHPFVAMVPPLVVALQLATIDRRPSSIVRITGFVILVAATILAANADERDRGAGRMARKGRLASSTGGRPSPTAAVLLGITVLGAVFVVGLLGPAVPRDGVVTWRTPTGLTGDYFGSIAYNPFVTIQKGLVSQTPTPVFTATIDGEVDPGDVYFRLLTLERYEGGQWSAPAPIMQPLEERPWEHGDQAYIGPTARIETDVTIEALSMDWLPAPYAPIAAGSENASVERSLRVRTTDASLRYHGGLSYTGMTYSVAADVPLLDARALATTADGRLSPLFATAGAAEEDVPAPAQVLTRRELVDRDTFVDLPDDIASEVGIEAQEIAANLATPFERGLALEKWFRVSGGFVYDVTVENGHEADTLSAWLFDDNEENPDYRRGYCEQFATSMAVMARTLDIPSRVVLGFTPGEAIGPNRVVVRDRNAHAWVELWIPSQGWVRFDPTPRSDGINPETYRDLEAQLGFELTAYLELVEEPPRPDVEGGANPPPVFGEDEPLLPDIPPGGQPTAGPTGLPGWLTFVVPLVLLTLLFIGAIPLVKWVRRGRRMRRLESGDISAAWEEIVARLTDLGDAPDAADTPHEYAAAVDDALEALAGVYGVAIYGSGPPTDGQVRIATESLETTTDRLSTRYSTTQRLRAWYRLSSLVSFRRRRG